MDYEKHYSKPIVNIVTGETYPNAKQLWRERYSILSYGAFNYYLRGKITKTGKGGPRKLFDNTIYDWKYENQNDYKTSLFRS